jgi:pSer/pThr/pTyr-binding forkhead associated (FHA) protein
VAVATRPAIELQRVQHEADGAYLFIEDEGRVLRLPLDGSDVRIGRDQGNDIWIDNQQVRPQTCLVYARDGDHHLKVFDGAKVQLNGQPVRGLHRLYSGDRIGVGDRELIYARDDVPPEVALGLTVMIDGDVAYGLVFRRTRVRLGRQDADLVLSDPSVSNRHVVLECYSEHSLYACDLGSEAGTWVNGERVDERRRLHDGDTLQLGRVNLRLHLLPVEAHGLLLAAPLPDQPLVPIAAPKPMDRAPGQRHDPGAFSPARRQADARPMSGGLMRPLHSASVATAHPPAVADRPAAPEPLLLEPITEVGHADDQPATQIGSLAQLQWAHHAAGGPAAQPMENGAGQRALPALLHGGRITQGHAAMHPSAPAGLHEQHTEMLDTSRVRDAVGWPRTEQAAPTTAVLDTSLPPALPPMTRADRQAAETARVPTGAFDRPHVRVERPEAEGGRGVAQPGPTAEGERYRPGKASGAWDRPVLHDVRPRVQQRPLSEAERAANPQWYNPRDSEPGGDPADPDGSHRVVQQREIDTSRRPGDKGRG